MKFCKSLPTNAIANETDMVRKRILRALFHARDAMAKDIPDVFGGTVGIDETYELGQWKNKRKRQKITKAKHGGGNMKTSVFGI